MLQVGDIAPCFERWDEKGAKYNICADHVAGRFIAIVFCPRGIPPALNELQGFTGLYESFQRFGAEVIVVSRESVSSNAEQKQRFSLPFSIVSDDDNAIFERYKISLSEHRAQSGSITVLIRPNRHVLGVAHEISQAAKVLDLLGHYRRAPSKVVSGYHPPVLVVPDVLSAEDCQRLISIYRQDWVPMVDYKELGDHKNHDVKTKIPDYGRQDRIDHQIHNKDAQNFIAERLQTRLLPEIRKAFHYPITGYEGMRIACYEGERQGKSHGHRDNSLPEVAHRRFAMSINLNSENFEGGGLRFPEYGTQQYKPATGAALVFSCSILHEALQVSRGIRFVLTCFLYGDH